MGQEQSEPMIRVEVEAVNLLVSVTTKEGRSVTDLDKGSFQVFEDGKRQNLANFGIESQLPLDIALMIDTSASVKTKLDFEKRAAVNFVFAVMKPRDRTMLVEFDTGVTLVSDFTSKPTEVARRIKGLQAGGGTALLDAVHVVAGTRFERTSRRNTIIIISDGADWNSIHTLEEAIRLLQQENIIIYAIGTQRIGTTPDRRGEKVLKGLADSTGGQVFYPYSIEQLHHAFDLINEELRSLYSLTYRPTRKSKNGSYRKVKVRLRKPHHKLVVRHRAGYYGATDTN
jgi:Ca-activated chloride channel family protein